MLTICSVFDRKAMKYSRPFSTDSDVQALREFVTVVKRDNSSSLIKEYPEDFELVRIAKFDEDTGGIVTDRGLIITGNQAVNYKVDFKKDFEQMDLFDKTGKEGEKDG